MDGLRAAVILALLALSCNADPPSWKQVIPEGKEVVYKYSALVKAGTHVPHLFASQFLLLGKLHLQLVSDYELLVRLDDLEYELNNGKESEFHKTKAVPSVLTNITETFKILYEHNGTVKEIIVSESEPEYSLNMKKAIAATLQINWEKIPLNVVKPYAFSSEEKSLFGHDTTAYSIYPEIHALRIHRNHYMTTLAHIYENEMSDFISHDCEVAYEHPLTHDTQKLYVIDRTDQDHYQLKYIETNGGVYYHHMQAKSSAFYVYINQTFDLLEIKDKVKFPEIEHEHKYDTLKYILTEKSLLFENITHPETLVPVVENMLKELEEFIKEDKIVYGLPNMPKGQLINRILYILLHLDMTRLEEIYNNLSLKTTKVDLVVLNIYQELLPMVGSSSSLKFILKLIQENKLKDDIAVDVLQKMALYVKVPTEQLLTELDPLVYLNNVAYSVHKASILSYATLLFKLYDFNLRQGIHSDAIFIKYIEIFVDKLKTSKKLEEKYLYIDAFYNMKNHLVIKYLEPLVKGEWFGDVNLRYKGMITLSSVLTKPVHHDKLYELYWPIFVDRTLPSYMRIMAFHIIMKSKPNLSYQINIYSFMVSETDPDLQSFYYTFLKSIAESENPCLYKLKLEAKQLLLYWPIFYVHNLTQFQKFDATNWKYNYGQSHDLSFVSTKDALVFYWKMDTYYMHREYNDGTFFIRAVGLDGKFLDNIHLNTQKGSKFFNYDELFKIFNENTDNVQIDIAYAYKGQILENAFFDKNNMKDFTAYFKIFYDKQFSQDKKSLEIHYDMAIHLPVITDIGFPVFFDAVLPSIHETTTKVSKEEANKIISINIDNKYRILNYNSYGLVYYNPFASVWQGIRKYMYAETQFSIYLDAIYNSQQNTLKLSWKKHQNQHEDVSGYRNYVNTYVFVKDYLNQLPHSSHFEEFVSVTYEDNYKQNVTFYDEEEYALGYKYTFKLLNDANPKYYQHFPTYEELFVTTAPWKDSILKFILSYMYSQFQFDVAERGIFSEIQPSANVTSVDLTIRFNHELGETGLSLYQPAMKINLGVVYSVKKEDEILKSWTMNGALDLNNGHTANSLKLEVTRSKPGEDDYKICIQSKETYSITELADDTTVAIGPSADGKCNKDGALIELKLSAVRSPEQYKGLHNYEICRQPVFQLVHDLKPFMCYADRSSIRNYKVDMKATKLTTDLKNTFKYYWMKFLAHHYKNYEHVYVTSNDVPEDTEKLELRYPISKDTIDARLVTPVEVHKFKGLNANDFKRVAIYPDNLLYGNINYITHYFDLINTCIIDKKDLINYVSDEWILLLADSTPPNIKNGIWIKLIDGKLAVKSTFVNHVLLISVESGKYKITLDEGELHVTESYYHENFGLTKMEDSHTLVYFDKYYGSSLIYNEDQLFLEIPKLDVHLYGKCV